MDIASPESCRSNMRRLDERANLHQVADLAADYREVALEALARAHQSLF